MLLAKFEEKRKSIEYQMATIDEEKNPERKNKNERLISICHSSIKNADVLSLHRHHPSCYWKIPFNDYLLFFFFYLDDSKEQLPRLYDI